MCGGPEQSPSTACQSTGAVVAMEDSNSEKTGKSELLGDEVDLRSFLLELAANNDLVGFKQAVESGAKADGVGTWYGRQNGSNHMVLEQRTAAMIASLYGSLDVLSFILSTYSALGGDINRSCGSDGSTALHCAAAGGAMCAVETVRLLLSFGADLDALDSLGRRPADVIMVTPRLPHVKSSLERMLKGTSVLPGSLPIKVPSSRFLGTGHAASNYSEEDCLPGSESIFESMNEFDVIISDSRNGELDPLNTCASPLISSPEASNFSSTNPSLSSSPKSPDMDLNKAFEDGAEKSRDYPADPSLPDIKNSIYTTDEFRMFSFKVRPCSRAYSHDWTECPFVHPGENARRRDPRRYHYSCVPCPDFRKGACRRADACEYAHGVFECWLHPAQYRTRLCKDGTSCTRRVCFFAHTTEELRPLYVSTGSAVPSPRTSSSMDMTSLSPPLAPASPSSVLMVSAFSPSNPTQSTLSTPPMSPSATASSLGGTWQQPNVPTLHLPGVGLHGSRLRASLNARDLFLEDFTGSSELEGQMMGEFASLSSQALSTQALLNAAVAASGCGSTSSRVGKYRSMGLSVSPSNLEELFASEVVSSSRPTVHESNLLSHMNTQFQPQKPAQIHPQFQNALHTQINSQLLPQGPTQSHLQLQPGVMESQMQGHTLLHSSSQSPSFSLSSPGRLSPLVLDVDQQSCNGARRQSPFSLGSLGHATSPRLDLDLQGSSGTSVSPAVAAARAAFAKRDKRSYSSRDLGTGLAWSDWGSPTGKPEWGVQKDDLCKFRKSASFGLRGSEDSDLSWVQKLVKDGPLDADPTTVVCSAESSTSGHRDALDHSVLSSWIEQMHLDQIVA